MLPRRKTIPPRWTAHRAATAGLLLAAALIAACDAPGPAAAGKQQSASTATTGAAGATSAHALAQQITHDDPATRAEAFRGLARLGPEALPALPALMKGLVHADPIVRRSSAIVIGRIGTPAVGPLHRGLQKATNAVVVRGLVESLGEIGPPAAEAIPDLLPLLADPEPAIRAATATALGRLRAGAGAPAVTANFRIDNPNIADLGRTFLGDLGTANTPGLITGVQSAPSDRGQTREILESFGVPTWGVDQFGDEAPPEMNIVIAVGNSSTSARDVANPLGQTLLWDDEPAVREACARALGVIGPGAVDAVGALITALSDDDPTVVRAAAWSLGQFGPLAQKAVYPLERLARGQGPLARIAMRSIQRIRGEGARR